MITRYFRHTTGTTIYAKKRPLSATWATGIVMGTENAATGEFSFSLSEISDYEIYLRVGGTPASSDTVLGSFEACCTQSSGVTTILDVYNIFDYSSSAETIVHNGFRVYNDDLNIGDNYYSVMRITRVANVTTATFSAQVDTIFNALPGIQLKGALIDYPLPLNPTDFQAAWAAAPNTLTISHATINSVGAGNALPPVDIISLFSGVTTGETVTILVQAIDDNEAGVLLSNIEIDLTPAEGVVGGGGGACDDAATIYNYFTDAGREDLFKADLTGIATSAQIAALNNISTAQVQTSAAAALTAYDPPTRTEATADKDAIIAHGDVNWLTAVGFATSGALATVAGYLDTEIAAILEDTGITIPGQISALGVPLNAAGIRAAVGLAAANLDTQLGDVPTVSEFNARTLAAAAYFNPTTDTVARVTLVDTTTTNTDMRGTDGANTVVPLTAAAFTAALPTNFGIMVINGTGEVTTSNPSTGGGGDTADVVYAYFANPNRPDVFKADLTGLTSSVAAVKAKTDQLQFTVPNQVDANALTGGGGDDAATIYNHFISGTNENVFKADLTGIARTTDITALNNLNSAAVQAAALAAIQSYDPPTRTEATADKDAIIARGNVAWITGVASSLTSADIYTYFVTSGREVPFQADVITALATYDVATRTETMADAAMIISHGDIAWVTGVGGGGGGGGGTTYGFDNGAVIERSVDDTNPIWFSWPVTGATITGLVRLDGAMAVAVTGAITEAFAENGVYFYSLAFDAADRTAGEGTALYKFTDGTHTQLIALRISVTGAAGKNTKDEIRAWVGGKWTDETGDNYELTITDI